jgi:hypothetical protein
MRLRRGIISLLLLAVPLASKAAAQDPGDALSTTGIFTASALVDSVFVDRTLDSAFVRGGDFGSYLMARLNITPIPPDLRIKVSIDTAHILLHGTIADLPLIARQELGPLLGMFPPQTEFAGSISLSKVAREVVRFRLESVSVNGFSLPEPLIAAVMLDVGRRYPALSRTGRDLFVEIPRDADVILAQGGVRLIGPSPADQQGSSSIH